MARLIVRNVEEEVARRLKEQASLHHVSVSEEHRRILKAALRKKPKRLLLRVVNPWESLHEFARLILAQIGEPLQKNLTFRIPSS
jgi:plasmid stability protein